MKPRPDASPDFQALFEGAPNLYLVLTTAELKIIAVNDAYCRATMTVRERILGQGLFDVFPDNPADTTATGVSNLRSSLDRVLQFRRPDAMAVQKYDIPRPASAGGGFEERYWSPLNTPILDDDGEVAWIIHRVEDVTELIHLQAQGAASDKLRQEQLSTIAQLRDANRLLAQRNEENAKLQQSVITWSDELQSEIAERKKTEESLKSTSAFHNLVVENIPAMVFVKDAKDHRFMLVNRAGEQLLGIDRSELIGKNDFDFFPKKQAEFFIDRDRKVFASGELQITPEEPINTRHQGVRILHTTKIPVFDEQGQPQYLVALCQDITERKHSETALQTSEAMLRQAQKMEAIGNLTGGMAHDFNNLLAVVIGNLDLLVSHRKEDSDVQQFAGEALDAALRGADLTQRLLAFARRQPLQPKRVDLNQMIGNITRLLGRTLGESVEIALDLEARLWPVVIDPAQLDAALTNLATNARDAMPKGGNLTIVTGNRHLDADYAAQHADVTAGDYAVVEITDTGAGMAPDVAARIFEPFFTTKDAGRGTGLGLSMVYGFMKQSSGHINVYSEPGIGTTFRLYLPRAGMEKDVSEQSVATIEMEGRGETVLAVEDNPSLRRVVVRQLRELGYHVLEAENASAALSVLENQPVHLLFTDVVMAGGMSGSDLAHYALQRWPGVKILVTSGFPEAKLNGGANGHSGPSVPWRLLNKPYRKEELARAIREALSI